MTTYSKHDRVTVAHEDGSVSTVTIAKHLPGINSYIVFTSTGSRMVVRGLA